MAEEFVDARKKDKPKKQVRLIILIAVMIVLLLALGAYAFYPQIKEKISGKKETASPTATTSVSPQVKISPTATVSKVVDEGVTWIKIENLGDLGLFQKSGENSAFNHADYYKVGTMSSGSEIILAELFFDEPGFYNNLQRFVKRDGKYYRLPQNSDDLRTADCQINYDGEEPGIVLKSILPDKSFVEGETEMIQSHVLGPSFTEGLSAAKKVGATKWGDLDLDPGQEVTDSQNKIKASKYFVSLNDGTSAVYEPKPTFLLDDGSFNITLPKLAGGKKFQKMATSGCGLGFGSFANVVDKTAIADKTELASSDKGSKIYSFVDQGDFMNTYGYKVYNGDGGTGKKALASFVSDFGVVLWIDQYGTPIVYSNKDYVPQAECAKPVVYLYPTETTDVLVKVGARMTKTDPEYNNGWKVTAEPNGEIITGGKTYPYLFWEGLGYGIYPAIKTGAVIARADVEGTIKSQLGEIGLNQKEIADFLEFWGPKMPDAPYVRLTWLTNNEMNALAPMSILPKPDSVIRVFLDFQGLNEKTNIPAQALPHYMRTGFTAVEWGGLLR